MSIHNLKDMLTYDEGCKLVAYKCSAGYWTVGIGHNLETNGLSMDAVNQIFRDDLDKVQKQMAEHSILVTLLNDLDKVRVTALVNMAFQLGVLGLLQFKNMLAALERKDWIAAYNHALDSKWYRDDTPKRAERVAQVLLSGTYNSYND